MCWGIYRSRILINVNFKRNFESFKMDLEFRQFFQTIFGILNYNFMLISGFLSILFGLGNFLKIGNRSPSRPIFQRSFEFFETCLQNRHFWKPIFSTWIWISDFWSIWCEMGNFWKFWKLANVADIRSTWNVYF